MTSVARIQPTWTRIQSLSREAGRDIAERTRMHRLIADAYRIVAEATEQHVVADGKRLAAEVVLYSGGNDSTVLAHLFRNDADYAVHINTGIGIEDTRRFVRDTCRTWDLPLIEEHGESYRDLVLDQGFPGPGHHFKMFQRLKERGLEKVRNGLVENPRRERVLFLAGRRRHESARRAARVIPEHERKGSIVWASPLVHWLNEDMALYRKLHVDVPVNPVSEHLHMSGECLCGAFAKPNELEEIRFFYPHVAAEIEALEAEVAEAGQRHCKWGWGATEPVDVNQLILFDGGVAPLCSSCEAFRPTTVIE